MIKYINIRRAKRLPIGTALVSRRPMQDVYDKQTVYVKTFCGWFSSKKNIETNQWVHDQTGRCKLCKEIVSYGRWYACTSKDVQNDSRYGGLLVESGKFDMSLISNEWHRKDRRVYMDARDVAIHRFLGEL